MSPNHNAVLPVSAEENRAKKTGISTVNQKGRWVRAVSSGLMSTSNSSLLSCLSSVSDIIFTDQLH